MRPSREVLHMMTAMAWAKRSTCKQRDRQAGVVITNPSMDEILAFGYNGPSRSRANDSCSWSEDQPHSRCSCLHAEINAFLRCRRDLSGGVMFVTMQPCFMCSQAIDQAKLSRVLYEKPYRDQSGIELLQQVGVEVVSFIGSSKEEELLWMLRLMG